MRRAVVILMVVLVAALPLLILASRRSTPEVWDDTLSCAKARGFPYRAVWRQAAEGDGAAIRRLLEFTSFTDGGGA